VTYTSVRLLTALCLLSVPAIALADPKPQGAQPANPQKVAQAYAGKTDLWEADCNGGIYFGPNWQARAWCADKSDNLGAGAWRVEDDGRMCNRLTWYWPNGNRAGRTRGEEICISHVADRRGKLWRSWPDSTEWWPMDGASGMVRGYKFQANVRETRSKLGL
jgi:hypothetical protein